METDEIRQKLAEHLGIDPGRIGWERVKPRGWWQRSRCRWELLGADTALYESAHAALCDILPLDDQMEHEVFRRDKADGADTCPACNSRAIRTDRERPHQTETVWRCTNHQCNRTWRAISPKVAPVPIPPRCYTDRPVKRVVASWLDPAQLWCDMAITGLAAVRKTKNGYERVPPQDLVLPIAQWPQDTPDQPAPDHPLPKPERVEVGQRWRWADSRGRTVLDRVVQRLDHGHPGTDDADLVMFDGSGSAWTDHMLALPRWTYLGTEPS